MTDNIRQLKCLQLLRLKGPAFFLICLGVFFRLLCFIFSFGFMLTLALLAYLFNFVCFIMLIYMQTVIIGLVLYVRCTTMYVCFLLCLFVAFRTSMLFLATIVVCVNIFLLLDHACLLSRPRSFHAHVVYSTKYVQGHC